MRFVFIGIIRSNRRRYNTIMVVLFGGKFIFSHIFAVFFSFICTCFTILNVLYGSFDCHYF